MRKIKFIHINERSSHMDLMKLLEEGKDLLELQKAMSDICDQGISA